MLKYLKKSKFFQKGHNKGKFVKKTVNFVTTYQAILSSQKLDDWWKLEISIFKFTPCHLQKRAGQITEKPLEVKNMFFKKVVRFLQNLA